MAKLDGYTLTERMRKIRRKHPLTASEQAVFHELVAICNEDSWADVFTCSNNDLSSPLQISENTLEKSRNRLIQVGLIFYKSGKSRRVYGQYSFTKTFEKEKTTSKTTSKFEVDKGVDKGVDSGVDVGVDSSDIIEEQTKTKTETKVKVCFGDKSPPIQKPIIDHWIFLTKAWFDFYGENFKTEDLQPKKPRFEATEGKQLKSICLELKKLTKQEWSAEMAVYSLKKFLSQGIKDSWLHNHFELKNLLQNFNSITNATGNSTNAHKPSIASGKQTGAELLAAKLAANIASFGFRTAENT